MGAIFQFLGLLFHKWVGIITGSFLAIYTGFYSTFTHGTYLPVWAALLVGLIGFLWAAWLVWLDEKKCGDDLAQEIARLQSIIDARPLSPLEVREQLEKLYERSAQLLIDMLKWPRVDNIEETNQWYDDVKSFRACHALLKKEASMREAKASQWRPARVEASRS